MLWPDTWNNYFHPEALTAGQEVLASAGFDVQVPQGHICCGRPLYDFGFLAEARQYLEDVMARMAGPIDAGLPVVFLEPSCASVFRDELRNFFPSDPRATRLREQSYLLGDFLLRHAAEYRPASLNGRSVVLHGHCHQKSQTKMKAEVALLERAGGRVSVLDSGCCGMAGPFGFEKEKFAISQALGGAGSAARGPGGCSRHDPGCRWVQLPGADCAEFQPGSPAFCTSFAARRGLEASAQNYTPGKFFLQRTYKAPARCFLHCDCLLPAR